MSLNLCDILKDCPKGTNLYCTIFGDVEFDHIDYGCNHPIMINICKSKISELFTQDGRLYDKYDGECTLFPSREQRDWNKFKVKNPKFDPNTLQPFDRVLVRDHDDELWKCTLFSHRTDEYYPFVCCDTSFTYCIPYNEETKHLVGTTEEAPEFYRYWEE